MGSGFSKMKKQAKMFQAQYEKMQEELKQTKVKGSSVNDLVSITLNGNKQILEIKINPECVDKDDVEGLQDLIIAAHADALKKLDKDNNMPGLPNIGF